VQREGNHEGGGGIVISLLTDEVERKI